MNKKGLLTAAAAAALSLGALTAHAQADGNDNFYYHQEGNAVYVDLSGTMELGDQNGSEVIWGFYDGGKLIKTSVMQFDGIIKSFEMDETRVVLPYEPENLEVKAFVWSDDGKCTPLSVAAKLSDAPADSIEFTAQVLTVNLSADRVMMFMPTEEGSELISVDTGNTDIAMHVNETVNVKLAHDGKGYRVASYSVAEDNIKRVLLSEYADVEIPESNLRLYVNNSYEELVSGSDLAYALEELKNSNQYDGSELTFIDTTGNGEYDTVKAYVYSKAKISGIEKKNANVIVSISDYTSDIASEYTVDEEDLCVYNNKGQLLSINEAVVGDTVYVMNKDHDHIESIIIDSERGFAQTSEDYVSPEVNDITPMLYIRNGSDGAEILGELEYESEGTPVYVDAELTLNTEHGTETVNIPLWSNAERITFDGSVSQNTVSSAELRFSLNGEEISKTSVTVVGESEVPINARGKIVGTSRNNDSLANDEVSVLIDSNTYTMKAQLDIKAMYEYSELMYTEDNGEYTLLSAVPVYGERTHVIAAEDILMDYSGDMMSSQCIPIAVNGTDPVGYELSSSARLFVNGTEMDATDVNLEDYLAYNTGENIYLVDEVDPASIGSGYGIVDYIFVGYYAEGAVDSASSTDSLNRIYLKQNSDDIRGSRVEWDPSSENVHIFKDGKEISINDINENDVLSIAYNVNKSFADSEYYDIYVTSNKISGVVEDGDTDKNTLIIDGVEYRCCDYMYAGDHDIHAKYNFYLNKNGYISYSEEDLSSRNYGVITGMYTAGGEGLATVQYVDKQGNTNEYKCVSEEQEDDFYYIATGGREYEYDGETVTAADIIGNGIEDFVFTYFDIDGGIEIREHLSARGGEEIEYNANLNKIGSYQIDKNITSLIYVDETGAAKQISYQELVNEGIYTAYAYDKTYSDAYLFIMITAGELTEPTEEVNIDKDEGIVIGMSKITGEDFARVTLLDSNAEEKAYECKDSDEENKFYTIYKGKDPADGVLEYDGGTYNSDYVEVNGVQKSVCSYSVKADKLELLGYLEPVGGYLTYNETDHTFGEYSIDKDAAKLVDVMNIAAPAVIPVSAIVDGADYQVYLFEPDENGVYGYGLFTVSERVIDCDTPIAVVQSVPEKVTVDGNDYLGVNVCTAGADDHYVLLADTDAQLNEGDIIIYAQNSSGIAENYEVVFRAEQDYDALAERLYASDSFTSLIEPSALAEEGGNSWKWNDSYGSHEAYFGAVYEMYQFNGSLRLIVSKQDGVSKWYSDIRDFNLSSSVNSYVCDYLKIPNKGERVYTSEVSSISSSKYHGAEDDDENIFWDQVKELEISPVFAFVRTDNGDVTEIVYYMN